MSKGNILVVDDEKAITDVLKQLFSKRGYSINVALDGKTALELIRKNTPAVVVLDMRLPELDGLELLKIIRADNPKTRVIAMTGFDLEYKRKIEQIGCHAFFIKPLLLMDLYEKVEELIQQEEPPLIKMSSDNTYVTERHPAPEPRQGEEIIPKARIALINRVRPERSLLLLDYFSHPDLCKGEYEIRDTSVLRYIGNGYFETDIILYDIALVGLFSEFASEVMKKPLPPKEIILFGDPIIKWNVVDSMVRHNIKYVEIPFNSYVEEVTNRLGEVVRETCIQHHLCK